jgi:hypothetical protein
VNEEVQTQEKKTWQDHLKDVQEYIDGIDHKKLLKKIMHYFVYIAFYLVIFKVLIMILKVLW